MFWLNGNRMRLVVIGIVAAMVIGGGTAKADFAFGPAEILGPQINTDTEDNPLCISSDNLEMYFMSYQRDYPKGTYNADLWVSRRFNPEDAWGPRENLGSDLNSGEDDTGADLSYDGLTLYISSMRSGGEGQLDLWASTRSSLADPWTAPANMGPMINSPQVEWDPTISPDGLELYFMSDRPGGLGGTDPFFSDIWIVRRASINDPWQAPEAVVELSSTANEGYTCISSDGLTMFLDSDRPGGYGGWDIYVSKRPKRDDPWSTPVNLGPTINTPGTEGLGALTPDGRMLYLTTSWSASAGDFADIWELPIVSLVDFNGDGKVNGFEFTKIINNWGQSKSSCDVGPTPLGDGRVDVEDLIILSEYINQDVEDPTLVAHWALDEPEGHIAHDIAGENDAEVMGEATWRPSGGLVDGALLLDGVDDCVATEYVRDPSDGPLSVLAWVKGGAPGQVVVSQILGANWLMADSSSGNLMTDLKESGRSGKALLSNTVITDGNWHRVGLVWDGINRILYVDDVVVATDMPSELVGSNGGLNIGCGKNLEPGSFWSGLIDDVRIYCRAVKP